MIEMPLARGGYAVPCFKPKATHKVDCVATSSQSGAVSGNTEVVRVICTVACHLAIGANPTATTSDYYLPAGVSELLYVDPGDKVAVIAAGIPVGDFYVTEVQ